MKGRAGAAPPPSAIQIETTTPGPVAFGTSIKIAYFNINAGQTANIYSMITYRPTPTDEANGQRLRYQGVRYADQKVTRTATATTTLAHITGGPGSIVYHSYVAGVGASNLTWLERNFSITVDGEPTPQIVATGTEDWFDSGWYFNGRRDYNTSFHSYVGTNQPAGNANTVGMATDLWSKWGGVPFTCGCRELCHAPEQHLPWVDPQHRRPKLAQHDRSPWPCDSRT